MAHNHDPGRAHWRIARAGLVAVIAAALVSSVGCSPEDGRTRGSLGADIGNTSLPIQMHGNREQNNPSSNVPERGRVPQDVKGVPGWWESRAQ